MNTDALTVFFFGGAFIRGTDGCHIRALQDLDMLTATCARVAVYGFRNDPAWPWTDADVQAFKARYPTVDLVLDEWTPLLRLAQKAKSIASYFGGAFADSVLNTRVAGVTPGLDRLRDDPALALTVVSYPWGLTHLNGIPAARVVVDTHDIASIEEDEMGAGVRMDLRRLFAMKREFYLLSRADEVWSISYSETALLEPFLGRNRVVFVPPATKNHEVAATSDGPHYDLMFVGSNNRWNGEALASFLTASRRWPKTYSIAVAGAVCKHEAVVAAAGPGVELLGYVPDIDDLLARSKVSICPVEGTGTKIKMIEALRAGLPVLAALGALSGLVPGFEECVLPLTFEGASGLLGDNKALEAAREAARRYSVSYDLDIVSQMVGSRIAGLMARVRPRSRRSRPSGGSELRSGSASS